MPKVRFPEIREARRWKRARVVEVPAKEVDALLERGGVLVEEKADKKADAKK
jgi:hypothetical protein